MRHSQFTNDTLFAMYPSIQEIQKIKSLLNTYEFASGKSINYEKKKIYGLNLTPRLLRVMSYLTYMTIDTLPRSYLGLLLFQGGNVGNLWEKIKTKISLKLNSQKSKWLSLAGCLVKIKSILSVIPIFCLSIF